MGIDYSKIRANLTARKMIKALDREGFEVDEQTSGSHQQYRHPDGRRVTVAYHALSDTFRPKTLKRMIEDDARWSEADLRRLKLLK